MDELNIKRQKLIDILGLKLGGENEEDLQLKQNFRLTLINQLNLINRIKQDEENRYKLSNANDLNSPAYNINLHFTGFNYWRKH